MSEQLSEVVYWVRMVGAVMGGGICMILVGIWYELRSIRELLERKP